MSETMEIIIGIGILVCVFILTRRVHAWRIKRAFQVIMEELKSKKAFDGETAVELPYAKQKIIRVGMRDFRPKALEFLITSEVVGMTEEGRYYLTKKDIADTDAQAI